MTHPNLYVEPLEAAAQAGGLAALDAEFAERMTCLALLGDRRSVDDAEFFSVFRALVAARSRVLRTLVPETWDGRFTDGGEA
jgi:hypothetical protein